MRLDELLQKIKISRPVVMGKMAWSRNPLLTLAFVITILSAFYWWVMASDRYVSEANIIVQRTDLPGGTSMDLGGVLASMVGVSSHQDQLILMEYLNSVDMLIKLDSKLALREHYSQSSWDVISRLWRSEMEWFRRYYQNRVNVYFDDRSGILQIRAEAYEPEVAQQIVQFLVAEGEHFMNGMANEMAREQVRFLENELLQIKQELTRTREEVVRYQNEHGLISPQTTVESLVGTLAALEAKRIEFDAQRNALRSYLVPDHPNILLLDQQIAGIEKQIADEKAKLAAPKGGTLNLKVEEFQRLEFEAGFAQEVYKTAMTALERGRVEAARTIKIVSVLQAPTMPEYPDEPRRSYNVLVSMLLAFLVAGIAHLILAIVREHKD